MKHFSAVTLVLGLLTASPAALGQGIGIGTNVPVQLLDARTATNNYGISLSNTAQTNSIGLLANFGGPYLSFGNAALGLGSTSAFVQQRGPTDSNPNHLLYNNITGTTHAFTSTTGVVKLGLGLTQPTATLHVAGAGTTVRFEGLAPGGLVKADAFGYLSTGAVAPGVPSPGSLTGPVGAAVGGSGTYVVVRGSLAYVTNSLNVTLQIFDVSNPAAPVVVGSLAVGGVGTSHPIAVALMGNTAILLDDYQSWIKTIDISNPAAPTLLSTTFATGYPTGIAVSGSLAFISRFGAYKLDIYNLANPAAPVLLSSTTTLAGPYGVAVSGNTAFVACRGANVLQAFDVSTPTAPGLLGSVATDAQPSIVALSGPTAYVVHNAGATLRSFNVANPAAMVAMGAVATGIGSYSLALSGNAAYVGVSNTSTLFTYDISTPASPALVGSQPCGLFPEGLAAAGSTVYVATSASALQIFQQPQPQVLVQNPNGGVVSVGLNTLGPWQSTNGNVYRTSGNVGIGSSTPASVLDVQAAPRTGTHATDRPLYVTADLGAASNGVEFRHSNGTQGLGFGFNSIYATGTNASQDLNLMPRGSGNVGVGTLTPGYRLDVNGGLRCIGAVVTTSDARLKQQVRPLTGALAGVLALRGVRYTFRQADFPALALPAGEQIGLLAQEVEAFYPELVSTDPQGFKAVNYAQLTPLLIEALKAQQLQIAALQAQAAQASTDHASLLTLQAQLAELRDAVARRSGTKPRLAPETSTARR